jgi:hypothetical protein
MDFMKIIACVCAQDQKDRELCGGFLASKGFMVTTGTTAPLTLPMAVVCGSTDKVKEVVKDYTPAAKKSKEDVRFIVIQIAKKSDRKSMFVSEHYHVKPDKKNKVKMFLELEDVIRKEKDISRGSKPKCRISVPV